MQFFVSFSATPSVPEATGLLELHTEKGAFAVPVPLFYCHSALSLKAPPLFTLGQPSGLASASRVRLNLCSHIMGPCYSLLHLDQP